MLSYGGYDGIQFHILADFHEKGATANAYGVYNNERGVANRSVFIINEQGNVIYSQLAIGILISLIVSMVIFFTSDNWTQNNGGLVKLFKPKQYQDEDNWRNKILNEEQLINIKEIFPKREMTSLS